MSALIILTLVCALTYTFEIVFGLAGTILMIPILSFWFPVKTLIVYSTLPQVLVAIIGIQRSPLQINWKFLGSMLIFASLGAVVGFTLFYTVPSNAFRILLASAITAVGAYLIAAPRRVNIPAYGLRILDGLAGVSQSLIGISGPIAMTRLFVTFPDKNNVRHYAFAFFLSLNILRIGEYSLHGTYTDDILWMMLVSAPFLIVTLWFSNQLHWHVNERIFRKVVAWMILFGGLSLFYR